MTLLAYIIIMAAAITVAGIFGARRKPSKTVSLFISAIIASFSLYLSYSDTLSYDRLIYAEHYQIYYSLFLDSPLAIFKETFQQIGWAAYNMLFRVFTDDPTWLLVVTAFIYIVSAMYVFQQNSAAGFIWPVVVFCISMAPLYSVSLSRQMLAAAIGNIAIGLCLKNRTGISVAVGLIGTLVHSSVAMVPLVSVVSRYVNTKLRMGALVLASFALVVFLPQVLSFLVACIPYLYSTMQVSFDAGSQGCAVALKGMPFLTMTCAGIIYRDRLLSVDERCDLYWLCTLVMAVSWIASIRVYWLWRLSFFFFVPFCLYMSSFIRLKNDRGAGLVLYVVICMLVTLTVREVAILYCF